jgi:colanic acid biosynthesis glycosyl transferase WcaI
VVSLTEGPPFTELHSPRSARAPVPSRTRSLKRLLIHDYSGHPFPVQLSRELASRGYHVLHLHCPSYCSGKGALELSPADPETLVIDEVRLPEEFDKYSLWKRPLQERTYARRLVKRVAEFSPDVVLSANTPLIAQRIFQSACRRMQVPFVFWHQELYSFPIRDALRARLPVVGRALGSAVVYLEASTLRRSDGVVSISDDFAPQLDRWGVPERKLHVIENWAPLPELPLLPRQNQWAREHGLGEKRVLLYSGTLGVKHNPDLLLRLARHFRTEGDVQVVVVSEGVGGNLLARAAADEKLSNLVVLGFQPYERLPEVLASADVLLAILERDAGVFAIPSKVLTYLCAGRPLLGAVPPGNLAARTIERSGGGVVVDPRDADAFVAAAADLLGDAVRRTRLGERARTYAEDTFGIGSIGDGFEEILEDARLERALRAVPDRTRLKSRLSIGTHRKE